MTAGLPPGPAAPPPPPGPYPPPGPPHYQPPPVGSFGYPRPPPQASSEAIAALVLGAMAWSCFPMGVLALWFGVKARRQARENPDTVGGEQLALIGMILGGVFGGIQVLVVLVWLTMAVALGFAQQVP